MCFKHETAEDITNHILPLYAGKVETLARADNHLTIRLDREHEPRKFSGLLLGPSDAIRSGPLIAQALLCSGVGGSRSHDSGCLIVGLQGKVLRVYCPILWGGGLALVKTIIDIATIVNRKADTLYEELLEFSNRRRDDFHFGVNKCFARGIRVHWLWDIWVLHAEGETRVQPIRHRKSGFPWAAYQHLCTTLWMGIPVLEEEDCNHDGDTEVALPPDRRTPLCSGFRDSRSPMTPAGTPVPESVVRSYPGPHLWPGDANRSGPPIARVQQCPGFRRSRSLMTPAGEAHDVGRDPGSNADDDNNGGGDRDGEEEMGPRLDHAASNEGYATDDSDYTPDEDSSSDEDNEN
ncbi:hypothetical protein FPV67DRAFT_1460889 [Lyophyllum atratum]|nr:hypothetical protein FPV67DRAFT_1460889 [Lyophyllum atratum]